MRLDSTDRRPPLTVVVDLPRPAMWVSGELDISTCDEFEHALQRTLAAGSGDIAVDVRDVTFLDAAAVRVLRASSRFGRLLQIGGLEHLLDVGPAASSALAVGELPGD